MERIWHKSWPHNIPLELTYRLGEKPLHENIEWSRQNMAAYKYPRHIEFRSSLPASGTGKLLRRLLTEDVK